MGKGAGSGEDPGSRSGWGWGYTQHDEKCERDKVVRKMAVLISLNADERAMIENGVISAGVACNCDRRLGESAQLVRGLHQLTTVAVGFVEQMRAEGVPAPNARMRAEILRLRVEKMRELDSVIPVDFKNRRRIN